MSRIVMLTFQAIVVGISVVVCCCTSVAAGDFMSDTKGEEQHEQSWYREQSAVKPDSRAIVQQKAQIRAEQRMSRLASMNWYGMSNGRPTGASTPFTSRYSPVWEMPGGKPFSWYPNSRPGYVMYWR